MQRIAKWQREIEDPSTSPHKKRKRISAVHRYEEWIRLRKVRIETIEEEVWSEERKCKMHKFIIHLP